MVFGYLENCLATGYFFGYFWQLWWLLGRCVGYLFFSLINHFKPVFATVFGQFHLLKTFRSDIWSLKISHICCMSLEWDRLMDGPMNRPINWQTDTLYTLYILVFQKVLINIYTAIIFVMHTKNQGQRPRHRCWNANKFLGDASDVTTSSLLIISLWQRLIFHSQK